jgi:hypothetical protein
MASSLLGWGRLKAKHEAQVVHDVNTSLDFLAKNWPLPGFSEEVGGNNLLPEPSNYFSGASSRKFWPWLTVSAV